MTLWPITIAMCVLALCWLCVRLYQAWAAAFGEKEQREQDAAESRAVREHEHRNDTELLAKIPELEARVTDLQNQMAGVRARIKH